MYALRYADLYLFVTYIHTILNHFFFLLFRYDFRFEHSITITTTYIIIVDTHNEPSNNLTISVVAHRSERIIAVNATKFTTLL